MATSMATSLHAKNQTAGRINARPLTDLAIRNLKVGESRTDGALRQRALGGVLYEGARATPARMDVSLP